MEAKESDAQACQLSDDLSPKVGIQVSRAYKKSFFPAV
jgi:hypothetical protein